MAEYNVPVAQLDRADDYESSGREFKSRQAHTVGIGDAGGKVLRDRALAAYYVDPNRCLYCSSIIEVGKGQKVHRVRKKKFCSRSHAASYNNVRRLRKKRSVKDKGICERCGVTIRYKRDSYTGRNVKRKYCEQCHRTRRVGCYTKGELRNRSHSYRTWITRNARVTYVSSGRALACAVCRYSLHVDICHIRGVADFSADALVREINALENLIALCPNHHWEFDHRLLELPVREHNIEELGE